MKLFLATMILISGSAAFGEDQGFDVSDMIKQKEAPLIASVTESPDIVDLPKIEDKTFQTSVDLRSEFNSETVHN